MFNQCLLKSSGVRGFPHGSMHVFCTESACLALIVYTGSCPFELEILDGFCLFTAIRIAAAVEQK
jgi:hypothetical protein